MSERAGILPKKPSTSVFVDPRDDVTTRPKAVLSTFALLGVIYTASISGGYGLEDSVKAGGPLLTIFFLCLIPFVWGIPVSLCVAELACAIPSNAGPIMWVNVTFAPWFTFCTVLWTAMLNFVDNSLYPTVFADYCGTLFELTEWQKALLKIVFLWGCACINMVGVHIVGAFSIIIMLITIFILTFAFAFAYCCIPYKQEMGTFVYCQWVILFGTFLYMLSSWIF